MSNSGLCFPLYFISSRTQSPRLWDVNYGKLYLIVPAATEKVSLESVEEYSDGKVHKSEHEPRKGNVNTAYSLIRPGEYSNESHGVCLR